MTHAMRLVKRFQDWANLRGGVRPQHSGPGAVHHPSDTPCGLRLTRLCSGARATRCACTQDLATALRLTMKPDTHRTPMVNGVYETEGRSPRARVARPLAADGRRSPHKEAETCRGQGHGHRRLDRHTSAC